ncbi:nucleotidyltransferase domain-containing protein [Planococcus sp. SE5232]|uniref:nucleotidyltransferase domain-containing protein n=1 Tax=unclassified Planococcus (in: firmicutes) TaxID=2662419 RepID=UPI003D6BDA56
MTDVDVLAIYLAGSLAKQNFDNYSDIDLHIIVKPEKKNAFIEKKCIRAEKWGHVLFHENANPRGPVVVTHYNCFVKVDSWYHALGEIMPSIWLKGVKVLYDPNRLICPVIKESSEITYKISIDEVEFWKGKILAFAHETYRAVMREEMLHAEFNLDRMRWLVVSGWYMEMDEHFDASYGSWSKVEGKRSILNSRQLSVLEEWRCRRESDELLVTVTSMIPEILRLNRRLSEKTGMNADEKHFQNILEMVT